MNIVTNNENCRLYIRHILQEVFPQTFLNDNETTIFTVNLEESVVGVTANANLLGISIQETEPFSNHSSPQTAKTCAIGKCIIKAAEQMGFSAPPYGVLTGVRPLKIANSVIDKFANSEFTKKMSEIYLVSEEKSELLRSCSHFDDIIRKSHSHKDISIYISIPFCPTRCNYCSFVSSAIERKAYLVPEYLERLFFELDSIKSIVDTHGLTVRSIYVGGGTPGILTSKQIYQLMSKIEQLFLNQGLLEITYEIGRPDTVTKEKLNILKSFGVERISINTQSTNNEILKRIGRAHTAQQYFDSMNMATAIGFDVINTDLIAGLNGESAKSFLKSINDVISSGANNITVHTLSVKKSADISNNGEQIYSADPIDEYINNSKNICISQGYQPYYLYRQKYALGNHESVGYCKDLKYSHYNIAMMNEIETVIGAGAGATSRVVGRCNGSPNLHFENFKYPEDYIRDTSKMLSSVKGISEAISHSINI